MKRLFLSSQFSCVAGKLPWGLLDSAQETRVCFVITAATLYDDPWWMENDREKLLELGFYIQEFDLRDKTEEEVRKACVACDCIFVAGGNTFFLLYHARKSGFDTIVKEFVDSGKVYIGSSAGSVLTGPSLEPIRDIDDEEEAPKLKSLDALNIIDTIILPHHGAAFGSKNDAIIKEFDGRYNLMTLTDNQVLIVEGDRQEIVEVSAAL